jgi:hypothetical protein
MIKDLSHIMTIHNFLQKNTSLEPLIYLFVSKVVGIYILLADDDHKGYGPAANWEPRLYEYQQKGSNVLFFTFVHPQTMEVPKAFQKLAKTRGTDDEGAVPANTVIIFSIGNFFTI